MVKKTKTQIYQAGRASGKTSLQLEIYDICHKYIWVKRWLLVVSILWFLTSVWSFMESNTINRLKRENEGLKRQIEVCYEQKDRLDNDVRSCLEFEQNIDKYCTCKEDIYENND